MTPRSFLAPALALTAGSLCGAEPSLAIHDEAPACFVAEAYPRVAVQITPADQVVRARLLFRPDTQLAMPSSAAASEQEAAPARGWYAVALKRDGDSFKAVLPRPRMGVGRVRYVVEATDTAAATVRGEERSVEVVGGPEACGARKTAESVTTAEVDVELPPGAPWTPPVPQGFSPIGATATGNLPKIEGKGGHKGLFLAVGTILAAGAGATQIVRSSSDTPAAVTPAPPRVSDVLLLSSNPAPGTPLHVNTSAVLTVTLRILLPDAAPSVTVNARIYPSSSPLLPCGTLRGTSTGLLANTSKDVQLHGLDGASPCGLADRMHVSVLDDRGREILATGSPDQPDLVTDYFLLF